MRNALLTLFFVSLLLTSCQSVPTNDVASSASYVGDRAFRSFEEVVASIQALDVPGGLRNLHVELVAVVSSSASSSDSSSSSYSLFFSEALGIVSRAEAGISAAIVETLTAARFASATDLSSLKRQVEATAQGAFDATFRKWSRAGDFEVRIVITSFYLTDLSVGKSPQRLSRWGD